MNLKSELFLKFAEDAAQVTGFIHSLASSYSINEPVNVLDIGCGPGRLFSHYQKLGWPVKGYEPDREYYETAMDRSMEAGRIEIEKKEFLHLDETAAFDLVVSINSFAYILYPEERIAALKKIRSALRPGGMLYLEMGNHPVMLENLTKSVTDERDSYIERLTEHYIDSESRIWTRNQTFIIEDPRDGKLRYSTEDCFAIIEPEELIQNLNEAGFSELNVYDSYNNKPAENLAGKKLIITSRNMAKSDSSFLLWSH